MLRLDADVKDLVQTIVDHESVSGDESGLADMVDEALGTCPHLDVVRTENQIVARTHLHRRSRILIAGHLDTVPVAHNLPSRRLRRDGKEVLVGRGTVDMKGGVAVQLSLAACLVQPTHDLTWVFYDNEEVDAKDNGLGKLALKRPDLLDADMAILMEPTDGVIEAGCQGTMRAKIITHGVAAHSARSWLGHNAIHDMTNALRALRDFEAVRVEVDGLEYREGLNAVLIMGGVAGNVIPDRCEMTVNYRFAPDKDASRAEQVVRDVFSGFDVEVIDMAEGARPGLDTPIVSSFVSSVGAQVRPKYGWTDVARFSALGIPAVNFGPGDPNLSHTDEENVILDDVEACRDALASWLSASPVE